MNGIDQDNIKRLPTARRPRSAAQHPDLRIFGAMVVAVLLVALGLLLLQKRQSDQQEIAIRDLSVRLAVVERRTQEMWARLELPDDPTTYALAQL